MNDLFIYDKRLGIRLPRLEHEWEMYSKEMQAHILSEWERIRGTIPDRIKELESLIIKKQQQLEQEDNFTVSCKLNEEISELASIINDLSIWYRTQPALT